MGEVIDAFAEDRGRLAACWPVGAGEGRATFWDLRERSRALASRLREQGVGAGEMVAIALPVGIDWAVAHLAVLSLGAVAAPVDPREEDLAARIAALSAAAVIAEQDLSAACVRPVPVEASTRSVTGASSEDRDLPSERPALRHRETVRGSARAAVRTAAWIHAQRHVGTYWLDLRRTDLLWLADDSAQSPQVTIGMFAAWSLGVPVLFASPGSGWEPLRRYPVSVLLAGVETCRRLAGEPGFSTAHLRHCAGLGAPLPGLHESWRDVTGLPLHAAFGVPECPILLAHLRGLPVRPGSVGRPFPGHDVFLLAPGGGETEPGEAGELVLRGRPPTRSIEGVGGDTLRTGVRGVRDEQGYFRVEADAETLA